MAPINYTHSFHHTAWVDFISLVQASGDDGFNNRFDNVEKEFTTLQGVIKQISDALNQPVKLTLTPTLTSISPSPTEAWIHELGGAIKQPGASAASGMMPLTLPQGYLIQSLQVTGSKTANGTLLISLYRHALNAPTPESIVTISLPPPTPPNISSSVTQSVTDADKSKINNDAYRYYVVARLAGAVATDEVKLTSFQLTCAAA